MPNSDPRDRPIAYTDKGAPVGPLVRDDWDAGIRHIAQRCHDCGSLLLLRFAPINERERASRDWSQLDRWVDSLHGLTVAKPILLIYPDELMWDATHVNARGCDKFAPTLAADIQRVLQERDQSGR
jgi:hypothetical protein